MTHCQHCGAPLSIRNKRGPKVTKYCDIDCQLGIYDYVSQRKIVALLMMPWSEGDAFVGELEAA